MIINKMTKTSQVFEPALYIVATPIGNLADITLRALELLRQADLIACEDTRTSGKLLSYYGIKAKTTSYHEHNEDTKTSYLLEEVSKGKIVALISDAGTPLISDPGYRLVKEAVKIGIKIVPLPGASSVIVALAASGLPTDRFMFVGFLPSKAGTRAKAITEIANIKTSLVLFESVHRLTETLTALAEILGTREALIARELTKLHEELRRGTLEELSAHYKNSGDPKGEVVIVISPPIEKTESAIDTNELLQKLLQTMSLKDAVSEAAKICELPRKQVYKMALEIGKK